MLHHEAKMAVEEWFLQEEGCLQFNGRPISISYSPTSHCFIATLEDGSIEVLDVSSGRTLKRTFLEGVNSSEFSSLQCRFCPEVEKLFVSNSNTVGLRKDLNGVLLLDSILQAPVAEDCDTPITLELTVADAKQLQCGIEACIPTAVPPVLDVMETLREQIKVEINKHQTSSTSAKSSTGNTTGLSSDESDKAAKWNTCKLQLPAGALLCAFDGMVTSLHKSHRTSTALPIASAMLARVMALTGTSVLEKRGQPVYKQLMFVEAARRQTFSTWPHTDYKWAYPEAMAQAGFYHQPACTGDDRAMCFTCSVCLVCWEPTDEPWSEHERHSAECPFVRGDRTENVPMCVSLATTPAKPHGDSSKAKITSISCSSCPCLMATSSDTGHIVVWDLSDQLKVYSQFMVDSDPEAKQGKSRDLSSVPEAWSNTPDTDEPIVLDPIDDSQGMNTSPIQEPPSPDETVAHLPEVDTNTEPLQRQEHGGDSSKEIGESQDECRPKQSSEVKNHESEGNEEVEGNKTDNIAKEPSMQAVNDGGTSSNDVDESNANDQGKVDSSGQVLEENNGIQNKQHTIGDTSEVILGQGCNVEEDVIEVSCEFNEDYSTTSPIIEEPEETSAGIVEEPAALQTESNDGKTVTEDDEATTADNPKSQSLHVTASAIMCPPDQDHQHLKKLHTVEHKPVVIAGIHPCLNYSSDNDKTPYLLLFDASSEKKPATTKTDKAPHVTTMKTGSKVASTQQYGGSQEDLYSILSSDDDFDQELMMTAPATMHSSLIKKCAEAIAGKPEQHNDEVKMKQHNVIQKLTFPSDTAEYNSTVSQIIPCLDGHHVLVVVHLQEQRQSSEISSQGESTVYLDHELNGKSCTICNEDVFNRYRNTEGCLLLLYQLILSNNSSPTLSEPLTWKKLSSDNCLSNVIGIPVDSMKQLDYSKGLFVCDIDDDFNPSIANAATCSGRFAGITQDGSILILNANTLDTLTKFSPTGVVNAVDNRFNDIVYCPGIDCLCCSTPQGNLYFLSLVHNHERTDSEGTCQGMLNGADALIESISLSEECTIQSLLKMLQKTEFENLVPRFTAIVPPSWSEVQQEQQQRQHPQHLHQQSLGDATLHTRTWRLQPEGKNNATGEQIFELLLPKQCHVGHVDIKFTLNNTTNNSINVYLLKPWSLKSWQVESSSTSNSKKVPILSSAKENGHILCGPVEIQKGSHQRVALTCPDLVKTRHRILLLVFETSQSLCPLEEVSLTVRRFKFSPQSNTGYIQYAVMLEEPAFQRRLVEVVCNPGQDKILAEDIRKLALNLLCWMAGICVYTPIRKNSLIHQVEAKLQDIIPVCFLQSGRSVAHQCSVLLLLCARQSKWDKKYGITKTEHPFHSSLLQAILHVLPYTTNACSAGALHSLFSVLIGYAALADVKQTSAACQELLTEVSTKMDSLMLNSHNILQGRYGLYGLPFEPVLFDLTLPPTPQSSTPTPVNILPLSTQSSYPVQMVYQSQAKAYLGGPYGPRDPPMSSTAASSKTTGLTKATGLQDLEVPSDSGQYLISLIAHQGLLEVEPLHFTCISTSDGARVERAESSQVVPVTGLPTAAVAAAAATGQALSSILPTVSVSTEPDIEFLKQHYQQLAKIQLQHKQVLEKHKQELEELAMWSLFPKMLSKLEGDGSSGGDVWESSGHPYSSYHSGISVNLSQQKKMANRKTSSKGLSSLAPFHKQHSQLPLPQALIIERLHSGARHHVVLDLGAPMELTDIIIPSKSDLSSLSIDAWLEGEEKDAQRIAILSDIGACDCVLKDLHPPPVCQFIKLTIVGRPRSNARVRMKIGEFYGRPHTPAIIDVQEEPEHRLRMLESLYEEVHCHYSLACGKLETQLNNADKDDTKLQSTYQQCIDLQLQLNFVYHSITRLQYHRVQSYRAQNELGYDQMRVLCTCLVETLVSLMAISPDEKGFLAKTNIPAQPQTLCSSLTRELCEVLFRNLCIRGNPVLRVRVAALLLHTCGNQSWWGNFLAQVLQQFFSSSQHMIFPQERVFVVLSVLAQQSPDVASVLSSLLALLDRVLSVTSKKGLMDVQGIDVSLVGWVVLLLAHILNTCGIGKTRQSPPEKSSDSSSTSSTSRAVTTGPSDKWDFIVPSPTTQTNQPTSNLTGYRHRHHKLRSKLSKHEKHLHKQQKIMMDIHGEAHGGEPIDVQNIEQTYVKVKSKMTSHALKQHIKDLMKLRHQEVESGKSKKTSKTKTKKNETGPTSVPMLLPQNTTVPVMKKMMQLVLAMDQSCSIDLVLTVCKVVALLSSISQPTVLVTDILSQSQIESILRLCISDWGGPWTRHALITLLQDLLQGYKGGVKSVQEDQEEEKPDIQTATSSSNGGSSSRTENKEQPSASSVSNQEVWPMMIPVDWTDPFMSGGLYYSEYDSPPPVPSPPTSSVTSSLVIPPKPPVSSSETTSTMVKVSSALDARLELGVTMEAEWDFKSLQIIQTDAVLKGMTTSNLQRTQGYKISRKPASSSATDIIQVMCNCFDKLFSECQDYTVDLGHLLELWLRLNVVLVGLHTPKTTMFIPLSKTSLANMLSFLADCPTVSLQNLYLAFEVMRSVLEKTTSIPGPAKAQEEMSLLTEGLVNNPDLARVLQKTLVEGSPKDYGTETGIGTAGTGIKQVEVFLSTLAVALEKQDDKCLLTKFHNMMLGLLCTLAAENVNSSGRPLQVKPILRAFLKHPPSSTKELDVSLINKLLQLTMRLSLQHLRKLDEISLRASSHFHETPRLTTPPHFEETKSTNEPWIVHSTWLTKLLSLVIMLLQIPADKPQDIQPGWGEGTSAGKDASDSTQVVGGQENSTSSFQKECPVVALDDASDSMVKTLQAMAKAVEQNASQASEESHTIINMIEEGSSSSTSESETSEAEEEESIQSADTGSQADDKNEVLLNAKEELSPPPSPRPSKSILPDQIIHEDEICMNLLQCLNLCSSNNIGVLLTGVNILFNTDASPVSGDPVSVEDGILQVMSVIFTQLTHKDMLVSMVMMFLSGRGGCEGNPRPVTHVSEPFLWFLLRMLDSSKQIEVFTAQGGYELLFTNLVASYHGHLDDKSQNLIPVMRQLTKLAHNPSDSSVKLLLNAVWEAEKDNGLVNYAPFGTISCTRPSAHPAEALLKACAPHRRARSATWSYHFYPGELWCDLTIQLPTPILIHAVHILPHTTSLTTCPSYVALDYSVDGTVMIPASKPVMTSGLSVIKLQFTQPKIAQRLCIRCRRPRDSESLGLSQIKVWGSSLYGPPSSSLVSNMETTQSDCLNWICLLNHCLNRTSSEAHKSLSSSQLLRQVFSICISLLGSTHSTPMLSPTLLSCQEDVLHTLALEFSDLGQLLLKKLLVNPGRGSQSVSVGCSSVQLVFTLAKSTGPAAAQRLHIIAEWLSSLSSQAHISTATDNGLTGLVQAVAAVIWTTGETADLARCVQDEIKEPLFRSIYEWSQLVGRQEPLKQAIDYLICSLCHACPSYFQLLLHLTEAQSLVDQARNLDKTTLPVFVSNPSGMETLSRASQSPITSHLLLASGVLNVLHDSTFFLCNSLLPGQASVDGEGVSLTIECLSDVLSFMAWCTDEPVIKTWYGESGSKFWKPLMMLLGSGVLFSPVLRMNKQATSLPTRHRIALESAAINFFCQCIACHSDNQTLFAKLLCEVMASPCGMFGVSTEHAPVDTRGVGLDGFLRRLLLEALLQDEMIKVCVHYATGMKSLRQAQESHFCHNRDWHPRFGAGYDVLLLKGKLASTIEDLDGTIFPNVFPANKPSEESNQNNEEEKISKLKGELDELNSSMADSDLLEGLTVAAGINVKSKRAKASSLPKKISSQKLDANLLRQKCGLPIYRYHSLLGELVIPTKMTLSSLVNALKSKGLPEGTSCFEMSLKTSGSLCNDESLLQTPPLTSVLHIFAVSDGLAILSSRLSCPVVMNQEATADSNEIALPLAFPLPLFSLSASVLSRIPGHSLAAFGLFICLPGYANVLLQDRPKAQCLLRLLLGAEDDGNGGHVLFSQVASSLPTLPFQILRLLFNSKPLSIEEGVSLREVSLQQGAIQLVLMCLGVLSHHEPRVISPTDRLALQTVAALTGNLLRGSDAANNGEKQYWAKGTGFGTGSTSSDWDIENAMKKQRAEEAHSTCMLQVLASYIRPSGVQKLDEITPPDYSDNYPNSDRIPLAMMELLARSCLVPTLSSYLRNDSVLDMARHVPLYQAVLEVMRALATCPCLVHLLTPDDTSDGSTSLAALIFKMKQCVDTYSKTLRSTSQVIRRSKQVKKQPAATKPPPTSATTTTATTNAATIPSPVEPEGEADTKESDAEGLALLIPDIQTTATLIDTVLSHLHDKEASESDGGTPRESSETRLMKNVELSNEDKYLAVIKPLQFDMYEIISEEDSDRLEFNISYHFASTLRSATSNGEMGSPARARRLAQEITSLSTSLPLSSSSSVFVRCDETRLDIMKVLITGPAETPYANGCFEFDVYFPHNYPNAPMQINFETTGHHTIRFNPNLYNDGKVCLSILNTWHGRPEEKWNPQTSSFLQVLVSTQSLILVAEPYFNEPGYERSRGTPSGKQNSQEYNANIRQATVKWGMLEQLRKPCKCFKEVIESHFYLKKDEILQQCETWIREIEALTLRDSGRRAALHHLHSLRQHTAQLRIELEKLSPPKELEAK